VLHADMTRLACAPAMCAVAAFYALLHVPRHEQPALWRQIGTWLRPGGVLVATTWPQGQEATLEDD
jgi:hypothetical protein